MNSPLSISINIFDINSNVYIDGNKLKYIFPQGFWNLGKSDANDVKTSNLIFTGRVTHKSIGTAIQKKSRVILSIIPLGDVASNGDLYAPLYKHDIEVFTLGTDWLNSLHARSFISRILQMEEGLIHSNTSGVRYGSSISRSFLEVISRIGKGGHFWLFGRERSEVESITVGSVGFGRNDVDLILSYELSQEILDDARKSRKLFGWIPQTSLLNELSRELMRYIEIKTKIPSTLVLEKQKIAISIR